MTKYIVKGVGEVELTQKEFIAAGGEGKIYGKGQIAYKIFDDPAKMLPVGKFQELSVLTRPNIIKPDHLILDKKSNTPVGYSMKLVSGPALCQLFTKSFRQRNNIDTDTILKLVKELYELVGFIHSKNILIVDCNELNFLVSTKFDEVYAIDVNSYQTPSFPATVIMDSIRDRHCNNHFTKETDWFSWAIVCFQLLIGVHPYKGGHPDFATTPLDERMDARMKKNVSAFHTNATLPKICQPFDVIPPALRQWFVDVFEHGQRSVPPKDFVSATHVIVAVKQIVGSRLFEIMEIESYQADILGFYYHNGDRFVLTDKTIHINGRAYQVPSNNAKFIFTPKMSKPISVHLDNGVVHVFDVYNQVQIPFNFNASGVLECEGRIYVQNNTDVLELNFLEIGNGIQCTMKQVGRVLDVPGATKTVDGAIIQNLLGRYFASFFPKSGYCYQIAFPELDDYKIVDAKYEKNVFVVIGVKSNGQYDRFVFRIAADFSVYDIRKIENITFTGINFTVNDGGACILINEEEKVEVFSNKKDSGTVKVMDDPAIDADMKLCHDGVKIMFSKQNKLYSFSMNRNP